MAGKDTPMGTCRSVLLLLVASLLVLAHGRYASAAAILTVTPASIDNEYNGDLALKIAGLTAGQTVAFEEYEDVNANGAVDAGEMLILRFRVTDGQLPTIAGVRNRVVPGDEDGAANGAVTVTLNLSHCGVLSRVAGRYVFAARDGSGALLGQAPFTIAPRAYGQGISGRVAAAGAVVSNAWVLLFDAAVDSGGPIGGVRTDVAGRYSLGCPPGSYAIAAFRPGYVSNLAFSQESVITVATGRMASQDLALTPASRHVTGAIVDEVGGEGVPGVPIGIGSGGDDGPQAFTLAYTRPDGTFDLGITPGRWRLQSLTDASAALAMQGYVWPGGDTAYQTIDATSRDIPGVILRARRATSLIYGIARDGQGRPVSGATIEARTEGAEDPLVTDTTDADGRYFIGVPPGNWSVQAERDSPPGQGYLGSRQMETSVAGGQAVALDLTIGKPTAHLRGKVVDNRALPVAGISLYVLPPGGGYDIASGRTSSDGSFDLPVVGGEWSVQVDSFEAAERGLLRGPDVHVTIVDGIDVEGVLLVLKSATATIRGKVVDNTLTPIGGIRMHAYDNAGNWQDFAANPDGSFQIGAVGGVWHVGVDSDDAAERGLGTAEQTVTVVDGVSPPDVLLVLQKAIPILAGDVDGDGSVTARDAMLALRIALHLTQGTASQMQAADLNGDGTVLISDVLLILRRALGLSAP
jgi:hypothetical protein